MRSASKSNRRPIAGAADLRSLALQAALVLGIVALAWFLIDTTLANLRARGITTGFAFLFRPINMPIAHSWLEFVPGIHTYARALLIGILNTLTVSFIVIVAATVAGTLIGIARLSPNWLLARVCGAYVEMIRNVPVLLQLVFWYQMLLQLPSPRNAITVVEGLYISNRGIRYPTLIEAQGGGLALGAFALGCAVLVALVYLRNRFGSERLKSRSFLPAGVLLLAIGPAAVLYLSGTRISPDVPELRGFNFVGGSSLAPELSALVIGLSIYASAFVAEIVRAGILGVPKGQWEAAESLGLSRVKTLRKIVLPQALRIIVPPLTSEYLGITKNSSLAVAVGYPDLVAIVNTMISDTGQAVEGIAIIMAAFLTISLAVSALMNWYNRSVALVTR
ncbi:ABC transporter permease subunit [Aquamicrobium sp. LC103]|uniref:amino acid ABC transporter permease n=1 Tax=Aquamicrobium sp. LC103 TaxID=1120658 RepID=UPI00063ECAF9|nr:ABC transporter permease subunit [Aquamicrobium sp. LC103]TKT81030.1 ABC transporter permease subunit [Aquamicrobium sp. LC103]